MESEEILGFGTNYEETDGVDDIDTKSLLIQQNKKKSKPGSFQSMGLSGSVIKGISSFGYKNPTPIQRKTIPKVLEGKDVVAMARTGSGKTAAFLIPILEKLQKQALEPGARILIMSPTRELALQTLKFAKELGKYTPIRAASVLGGELFESQFKAMHSNPDLIIATPGRFMHLCIEMKLKLDNVELIVFDEADRLFEMGFDQQLREIIQRLPTPHQTVLLSATLPKLLVEFSKAGLQDPVLIRLDADIKVSETLTQTFFRINSEDRIPLLIALLKNHISLDEYTIIFVPTIVHCEYLNQLLEVNGIPNTLCHSKLHPECREINIQNFRKRQVNVMLVTDVAARGIDIPLLDNVINLHFPAKTKLYVHRVGRVARAGKTGVAYSFVTADELPYLVDLELFLNVNIRLSSEDNYKTDEYRKKGEFHMLFGKVPRHIIDDYQDSIAKMNHQHDLESLVESMSKALMKFNKCKEQPSRASIKKIKEELWGQELTFHSMLISGKEAEDEVKREVFLNALKEARPRQTIFEIKRPGSHNANPAAAVIAKLKKQHEKKIIEHQKKLQTKKERVAVMKKEQEEARKQRSNIEESSEVAITETFKMSRHNREEAKKSQKQFFIPYTPDDYHTERGYAVGNEFQDEIRALKLDLDFDGDEDDPKNTSLWSRKRKKYINTDERSKKFKSESGQWVPKSYKTNRYYKWKNSAEGKAVFEESKNIEKTTKFTTINKNPGRNPRSHPLIMAASKSGKLNPYAKNEVLKDEQVDKKKRQIEKKKAFDERRKKENVKRRKNADKRKANFKFKDRRKVQK